MIVGHYNSGRLQRQADSGVSEEPVEKKARALPDQHEPTVADEHEHEPAKAAAASKKPPTRKRKQTEAAKRAAATNAAFSESSDEESSEEEETEGSDRLKRSKAT